MTWYTYEVLVNDGWRQAVSQKYGCSSCGMEPGDVDWNTWHSNTIQPVSEDEVVVLKLGGALIDP